MKKLTALLLGLMCVLGMAACSGQSDAPDGYKPEAVTMLAEAGAFSEELEELDADTAFMLYKLADYGLAREDLTQAAVLRSAGGTCEEGAVLIFANAEQAQSAEQALKDYVSSQIDANVDYRPADIPKLEEAIVRSAGSCALLVVADDYAAAVNVVGDT